MRTAILALACVFVALAAGVADGQTKKKKPPTRPPAKKLAALAFDAECVKLEEKAGTISKLFYSVSEENSNKLGFKKGDHPVNRSTKFIFVQESGEKPFDQRTVLADEEAKKHLQPSSK